MDHFFAGFQPAFKLLCVLLCNPRNFPLLNLGYKLGPILATGCVTQLKLEKMLQCYSVDCNVKLTRCRICVSGIPCARSYECCLPHVLSEIKNRLPYVRAYRRCTCVIKPSELTPLATSLCVELSAGCIPNGVCVKLSFTHHHREILVLLTATDRSIRASNFMLFSHAVDASSASYWYPAAAIQPISIPRIDSHLMRHCY